MEYTATLNGARDGMVRWKVNINGQEFDYGEGIGHFLDSIKHANWKDTAKVHQTLAEAIAARGSHTYTSYFKANRKRILRAFTDYNGTEHLKGPIVPPELDNVLECLLCDAVACDMSFGDWCDLFWYEEDSRKALALYLECQAIGEKLRKAGVNIAAEWERLGDR